MFIPAFLLSLFMLMPISGVAPQEDGSGMQKNAVDSSSAGSQKGRAKKSSVEKSVERPIHWEEDVRWIITPEELAAFKQLKNDEEREIFIEQFWLRRDPTPDTYHNEMKEEHYKRIVFANEKFAVASVAAVPGWKTDRGRTYILYGPPDRIDVHTKQAGDSAYPRQSWRYRYIDAIGEQVEFEFVDSCRCNEFKLAHDPSKDPRQGVRIVDYLELNGRPHTPRVKFMDLEEVASVPIKFHQLPFEIRIESSRATDATTLVALAIEVKNKDITLSEQTGIPPTKTGRVEIFGRFTTLTGRIADILEDAINVKEVSREAKLELESISISRNTFALRPGRYRLDIVVRDVNGDRMGTLRREVVVPAE